MTHPPPFFLTTAMACGAVVANMNGIVTVVTTGQAISTTAAASAIATQTLVKLAGSSAVAKLAGLFATATGPMGWVGFTILAVGADPLCQVVESPKITLFATIISFLACFTCTISYLQTTRKFFSRSSFHGFVLVVIVMTYFSQVHVYV